MISLSPPTICNSATNTTLLSEKVVIYYEKRGNAENYIKEAKYDMAVGHLLLKSFWANEAVFQMMMLSYNLFLLFKFDSLDSSEYRQQIKTFRLSAAREPILPNNRRAMIYSSQTEMKRPICYATWQITRSTPTILPLSRNAKATGKKLTQSYQSRSLPFVPLVTLMRW
nr:transposase [Klebsiella pneumoniae]